MAPNVIIVILTFFVGDMIALFFNFDYYYILFQRYLIKRNLSNKIKPVLLCELNEVFEGMKLDFTYYFQSIFKIMFFCMFLQTLIPYVLIVGFIYLIILFFIMKYDITKRCNRPIIHNFNFIEKMFSNIEFANFLLAAGYFTF